MKYIVFLAFICLAFLAYVRLSPNDKTRWHVVPQVDSNKDLANAALRRVSVGEDGLRRLDAIVDADPRTQIFAGSVDLGHVTYITRSRFMGYPDFTSVMMDGDDLLIYARSRFGRRDFGVNAARVDRWIKALTAY